MIRTHTACVAAERSRIRRLRLRVGAGLLAVGLALVPGSGMAADELSTLAPLASRALLLDAQRSSTGRIVTVGERGHILISDDDGRDWRQVIAPTRATLTGVAFGGAENLVAVGHQGVVLRSSDAGETWRRVEAGTGLEDSLLDVLFVDDHKVLAVGAYGMFRQSDDAGATWISRTISDDGFHYNRIARTGAALFIVGEAGTTLRSLDSGATWEPVPTPYEGSFFGVIDLGDGGVLTFGLRGRTFLTHTQGEDWRLIPAPIETLLMSGTLLPDGRILLAGQSGNFLLSDKAHTELHVWKWGESTGAAEVLPTRDGALLVFGDAGVRRVGLPAGGKAGAD